LKELGDRGDPRAAWRDRCVKCGLSGIDETAKFVCRGLWICRGHDGGNDCDAVESVVQVRGLMEDALDVARVDAANGHAWDFSSGACVACFEDCLSSSSANDGFCVGLPESYRSVLRLLTRNGPAYVGVANMVPIPR